MLTQKAEDISEPGFGFENSFSDLFQERGYTENGLDVGGPAPDALAQASQVQEPDNKGYLAPSISVTTSGPGGNHLPVLAQSITTRCFQGSSGSTKCGATAGK